MNIDIWNQVPNPEGSTLRTIQEKFQKYMTFSPPIFHGRGVFQYDIGFLPHRKRIVTVVGEPVDCPKIKNPTHEDILKYQQLYIDALIKVYDNHRDQDRKIELRFIE